MKPVTPRISSRAGRTAVRLAIAVMLAAGTLIACGGAGGPERDSDMDDADVHEDSMGQTGQPISSVITLVAPGSGRVVTERGFRLAGSIRSDSDYVRFSLVLDSVVTIASGVIEIERLADESIAEGRFRATVDVESDWSGDGYVEVCLSDSAGRACSDAVRRPVRIEVPNRREGRKILVYFANARIGAPKECEVVYPVTRSLPDGITRVARAALYHLLRGPTPRESERGYRLDTPDGIRLQSIGLNDGVATLNFNQRLTHIADRCERDRFRAQIEQTLVQFESVRAISLTINGHPWDAN